MSAENGVKDTIFNRNPMLRLRGELQEIVNPWVMGILNLTPDSFYDGGHYQGLSEALSQTEKMLKEGAKIIDVGASSSRPGSIAIPAKEEIQGMSAYLKAAVKEYPEAYFSVDTYQAEVAQAAADLGVDIINDVSGGTIDPEMIPTVGKLGIPYVLMHMKGTPATMNSFASYENVFKEVSLFFSKQIEKLQAHNVSDIILDPGFGFAKNLEQNYELLEKTDQFAMFERPILIGISRKSMISKLLKIKSDDALNGTSILNTVAILKGASILRVHDVREAVEAVKIVTFIQKFS